MPKKKTAKSRNDIPIPKCQESNLKTLNNAAASLLHITYLYASTRACKVYYCIN